MILRIAPETSSPGCDEESYEEFITVRERPLVRDACLSPSPRDPVVQLQGGADWTVPGPWNPGRPSQRCRGK